MLSTLLFLLCQETRRKLYLLGEFYMHINIGLDVYRKNNHSFCVVYLYHFGFCSYVRP